MNTGSDTRGSGVLGSVVMLVSSYSLNRDQYLYNTDPLYLPEDKAFVTETQVIRETLW